MNYSSDFKFIVFHSTICQPHIYYPKWTSTHTHKSVIYFIGNIFRICCGWAVVKYYNKYFISIEIFRNILFFLWFDLVLLHWFTNCGIGLRTQMKRTWLISFYEFINSFQLTQFDFESQNKAAEKSGKKCAFANVVASAKFSHVFRFRWNAECNSGAIAAVTSAISEHIQWIFYFYTTTQNNITYKFS